MSAFATTTTVASICVVSYLWFMRRGSTRLPLPPGPPTDPLIGHLRLIPSEGQEETFHEWAQTYGDVIYLKCLGREMIILDSAEAANELLDKRGSNYSSRPSFPVFKLMGWFPTLAFLPYGKQFNLQRKIMQQSLGRQESLGYLALQLHEARTLLKKILLEPNEYDLAFKRFATAIVIKIAFGHQITDDKDVFMQLAGQVRHAVGNAGPPGNTPIDFFPFLQCFPSWFPGTYYAQWAREWRWAVRKLHDYPYEQYLKQKADGRVEPSFLATELQRMEATGKDDPYLISNITGAAASIYGAGADTTHSVLSVFVLAMVLHPEYQEKAQKEIDALLDFERLPEFSDRKSLPYVECILQEIYRWQPTLLLGIPHCALQDDIYRGMLIPKGSIVIANMRGISLNKDAYTDPRVFNPDRFLPKDQGGGLGEPPPAAPFGFGRRICPGRFLADASLWIAMVSMLTAFSISKAVGEDGREITPPMAFTTGLGNQPRPFKCDIKPRHKKVEALLSYSQ